VGDPQQSRSRRDQGVTTTSTADRDEGRVSCGAALWPDLSAVALAPTLETLHLFSQVAGKARLMLTPWENHGWHVPLYLTPRGLWTGLIPVKRRAFSLEFDLLAGALRFAVADGSERTITLEGRSLASLYDGVLAAIRGSGIEVRIDPMPAEIEGAIPFDRDSAPRGFDLDVARTYWRALLEVHRVFQLFRTRFTGKCSPIHLFWGAFDLAVTRFSGRPAPPHPGGAPHMSDAVAREAYSREVSSAGFWPNLGSAAGPCFYSYAYPPPAGYADQPVSPAAARFDAGLGEFILPYSAVRGSADPDAALLDFLQTTYEAAADRGGWDRVLLEREQGALGRPPTGS